MFLAIYDTGGPIALVAAVLAIGSLDYWIFAWSVRFTPDENPPPDLFARVSKGYFWSVNLLALPIALLTSINILWKGGGFFEISAVVVLPVIVFGQALLLGLFVAIGDRLRVYAIDRVKRAANNRAA